MDLFEYQSLNLLKTKTPLANRMRPSTLDDFVGQKVVNENSILYRSIKSDKITSLILYGPSGTGKTTLAKIIANTTESNFVELNGVNATVKEIKDIANKSRETLVMNGKKTILFIDEIHRFSKSQQDVLLPYTEEGIITFIGATTENPYFEVNRALISRSLIFKLEPLSVENIVKILNNAINDCEKGLGNFNIKIDEEALDFLATVCDGDARIALNGLELATFTTKRQKDGIIHINLDIIKQCIQKKAIRYDKNADNHYDTISAFIKSMRGSDPDAAIYYLAKMLYAGEDPIFIARRIVICASEDVGNADPMALQVAMSALEATKMIGMPECRIILAQAVIYVASSPKSNASYMAINKAFEDVKNIYVKDVPIHLKDAHYSNACKLGNGKGYKYSHNFENNYVKQQYLPDEIKDRVYYKPTENGYEKKIKARLNFFKNL